MEHHDSDGPKFLPFQHDLEREREARLISGTDFARFGIGFMDRALVGILPTDLVLIGAKTGIGKTELCLHIACHNVRQGKRVGFIALEAEPHEMAMRLKYRLLAQRYFSQIGSHFWRSEISYRRFRFNMLDEKFGPLEEQVQAQLSIDYQRLSTFYRTDSEFSINHLNQLLSTCKDNLDLVVIDHLHYFDLDSQHRKSEHQQLSDLVKQIRHINLTYKIPIVLVSHLRKNLTTIPEIEDFMGTSDIGKVATCAAILFPDYDKQDYAKCEHGTFIRIVKNRLGQLSRIAGRIIFDSSTNTYKDGFSIHKISGVDAKIEEMAPHEYPSWAKSDIVNDIIPF